MRLLSARMFLRLMNLRINRNKAVILLLILAASFLCSRYVLQFAIIQGDSMEPSYHHLQLVLVDKTARTYSRDDVIVFRKTGIRGLLIKRIAAGPGDHVRTAGGFLTVNGDIHAKTGDSEDTATEILLAKNQYFVLGDNRDHSIDSRMDEVGIVTGEEIIGCVVFPKKALPAFQEA